MTVWTREHIVDMLKTGVCEVTFTKIDGSRRVMPCTLNAQIIPPAPPAKVLAEGEVPRVKKSNPDNVSVWCTDKQEWRSFKIANLTDIKVLHEEKA